MTDATIATAQQDYLQELLQNELLLPTGVAGVYGKSAVFEGVLRAVDQAVSEAGRDQRAEALWFPPVINGQLLERTDYLKAFPHLAGTVHSFFGDEHAHSALLKKVDEQEDWAATFKPAGLALAPAACYPVYPAASGTMPDGGRTFEVQSYCFRHEPSDDPARMQIFRMHEYVRLGTPTQVQSFRDLWLERGQRLLNAMGLDAKAVVANDPFFGRAGRMLAKTQQEQALKFELVVAITSEERPTAVVSCNYHQDHFGLSFEIFTHDGERAHSACVGFGLERITLALLKTHGFQPERWPSEVRQTLKL
jgi:seryl-tRNA synthetase